MASSKQLKILIQQRNGFHLNVKKILNDINSTQHDAQDIENVAVTIEKLKYYQDKIENLNTEILHEIEDDGSMDKEVETASELREQIIDAIHRASIQLTKYNTPSSTHPVSEAGDSISSHTRSNIRLPKLEIETFNGDPLKWQVFWDSFDSTINSNPDISDVDKYKYLRRYLSSEALNVIEGYRLTSSNYSTVVEALQERFGNPEIAIFAHFESLLELQSSDHEYANLQRVYDSCEKHVRSLVALGLNEDTFGQVFTPIILSKLPRAVRIELHRRNESRPWKLNNLRELMKDEIKAREMSEYYAKPNSSPKTSQPSVRFDNSSRKPSRSPLSTQSALSNQSKGKVQCGYCQGSHFADTCSKYKSLTQRKAVLNGKCFKCLREGHNSKECPSRRTCFFCKGPNHHSSLCPTKFGSNSPPGARSPNSGHSRHNEAASLVSFSSQVQMQMAVVNIIHRERTVKARVFFDTGSTRSYMTTALFRKLGLSSSGEEAVSMAKFGNSKRKTLHYKRAQLPISTVEGDRIKVDVLVTNVITSPIQKHPMNIEDNDVVKKLLLADPPCSQPLHVEIDVLIGADYYYEFIGTERIQLSDGCMLLQSKLGYIVTGRIPSETALPANTVSMFCHTANIGELSPDIERFWSIEDIGVKDDPYQIDDEKAVENFNKTTQFKNGRYYVTWPWKDDDPELPSNYGLAFGRLKSLTARLQKTPGIIERYNETLQDQLTKDIIEKVEPNSAATRVHYIPHHCVIRENKATTKMRIVYDASAKSSKKDSSLNDCLLRGPVMLHDIAGMLLRFRLSKYGLSADIEKAFLQVGIQEQERDITRFLWLKDISRPLSATNLQMYRFCRVPFGIVSSPFLLAATVRHHLSQKSDSNLTAADISSNIYVDNVLIGRDSKDDCIKAYKEAKALFHEVTMNIREWYSNNKEFVLSIPENDQGSDHIPKVLGLCWNTKTDSLSCANIETNFVVSTKRHMLQRISQVFDPCGFFSPMVIRAKVLVQQAWKLNAGWDDKLPDDMLKQFESVECDLCKIQAVQIPRYIDGFRGSLPVEYEIHCFCDASAAAYAAACYVRIQPAGMSTTSNLVFCKARLAPLKELSIPRLELMAVVLGTRLIQFISKELRIPPCRKLLWSDSKCVLKWICSTKLLPVFVQNRVKEIRSSNDISFRYVPTTCNPADLPSRGLSLSDLATSQLWWNGPQFLVLEEQYWPKFDRTELEYLTVAAGPAPLTTSAVSVVENTTDARNVMDPSRCSSLLKLLRITVSVLKFIKLCSKGCRFKQINLNSTTATDISVAEHIWVHSLQSAMIPGGVANKKNVTIVRHLGLFHDEDGIVRCKGRLQNSTLQDSQLCPKLLPKNNYFTDLVIQQSHERLAHAGFRQTLAQVRLEYWIPQGMSQVKRVLRRCLVCRKAQSGSYKIPDSPPLPWYRVSESSAFEYVGIDYLGPLFIKPSTLPDTSAAPEKTKVWICLFTCAVIRAVHLEVVLALETEQFIMCLRRFAAIYGKPRIIVSDNARHFKLADRILKGVESSDDVQTFAASEGIEWKFITELAPWMGGFYERMIQSVKRALQKILTTRFLSLVELQTVVAEVAAIVNSRPLIPYDSEPHEDSLTPSHFLAKRGKIGLPNFRFNNDDPQHDVSKQRSHQAILERWSKGQRLLDAFWNTWRREYLSTLRERPPPRWNNRNTSDFQPISGSVVLIRDNGPRCHWKLGKINEVQYGNDDKCRSAIVRLASGKCIKRSIQHLYPIECSQEYPRTNENSNPPSSRPQRVAATVARQKIRSMQ